jgi:hypothetical protein
MIFAFLLCQMQTIVGFITKMGSPVVPSFDMKHIGRGSVTKANEQ